MPSSRVTIRDVAEKARVSRQTVSRVINGSEKVNPETRARVESVIEEMGYRPHAIARFMARGRTRTLAFLAPNLSDYTFARIIEGAETEARRLGYFLLSASSEDEAVFSGLIEDLVDSGRTDGLLILNPYQDDRHKLTPGRVPVVFVGTAHREGGIHSVSLNDVKGGFDAAMHLIELGHTQIAMITGPTLEDCTNDRTKGYEKAMHEAGLSLSTEIVKNGDWSATSGYEAACQLIESGQDFTGIFAQNDRMAVGAARAIRESGLDVPSDISIIGFDDMPLASYFHPPLTTMFQDTFQIGREAARMLISLIEGDQILEIHRLLPAELVFRSSTQKPAQK